MTVEVKTWRIYLLHRENPSKEASLYATLLSDAMLICFIELDISNILLVNLHNNECAIHIECIFCTGTKEGEE